jgi:hypothetical protein
MPRKSSKVHGLKKWEIIGYRQMQKPFKKVISSLLEVEARTEAEAEKAGKNYAKMMGVNYSHTIQKNK